MFDLTKKTEYGLELMIALAEGATGGIPISLGEIAGERDLPLKFLEQIAAELRDAGLVESKKGKGGGYSLTRSPEEISVSEIAEALAGPVTIGACAGCPRAAACGQKEVWGEVGDKVREAMEGRVLADLV